MYCEVVVKAEFKSDTLRIESVSGMDPRVSCSSPNYLFLAISACFLLMITFH